MKKGQTDSSSVSTTEGCISRQKTTTGATSILKDVTVSTLKFISFHSMIAIVYRSNLCVRKATAHTLLHTSGYSVLHVKGGSTVYVLKSNQGLRDCQI